MPIVRALFQRDGNAARAGIKAACSAPRPADLTPDFARYVDYRLPYLAFQTELGFPNGGELGQAYDEALRGLDVPPAGEVSARTQARLRLQLRCYADMEGLQPLPAGEFDGLLREADELGFNAEMWYFATTWAFRHQRADVIAAALEYLTINSTRYFADFLWQRINLMHLLLAGRASRKDVLQLVKRIEFSSQTESLQRDIWPACTAAGLIDAEVQQAFEKRQELLAQAPDAVPRPRRVTGRMRTDA